MQISDVAACSLRSTQMQQQSTGALCFSWSSHSWRLVSLSVIAYARKASLSYFCWFPLFLLAPMLTSSEVVVSLLRGLMLHHISASCWWCGPTNDKAALLWGQELPQLVLPARGVLVKPWCDLCCGELEHENGHQQIRGKSDVTEVAVSFSFRKCWLSFTYYLVWNCRSCSLAATKGGNYFNSPPLPEARD